MRKLLLLLSVIITLLVPSIARGQAASIFISQAGGGTGASCASPLAASFFNNSGNWGTGANQIGAGTTVFICGVITTNLTFQGSGSAGGTKICAAATACTPVTLDGSQSGAFLAAFINVPVQYWIIQNVTWGTGAGLTGPGPANGAYLGTNNPLQAVIQTTKGSGASFGTIQGNHIDVMNSAQIVFFGGGTHDFAVLNNFMRIGTGTGGTYPSYTGGDNFDTDIIDTEGGFNVLIVGNFMEMNIGAGDGGNPPACGGCHDDITQVWGSQGSTHDWVYKYNYFKQNSASNVTQNLSFCIEESISQTNAGNWDMIGNVFQYVSGGSGGNGCVFDGNFAGMTAHIYNNTMYAAPGSANNLYNISGAGSYNLVNNITYSTTQGNALTGGETFTTRNFNLWFGGPSPACVNQEVCGQDPKFKVIPTDLSLQAGSPAIGLGTNLGATYNTGPLAGATWPNPALGTRASSGNWDAGAFVGTSAGGTVTISPTSHSYGPVTINTPSGPGTTYTITSTLTTSTALAISNVGGNSADFPENATTTTCTTTLPANSSCNYVAFFQPSIIGAEATTLTVTDSVGTQTSALSGTGIAPAPTVTFAPSTGLGFGNVILNNPVLAVDNLRNTGAAVLNITSITLSGAGFTLYSTCGSTLAAGQTCELPIKFIPTTIGAKSGTVTVVDNAAGSPHTFTVTGTGISGTVPPSDQYGGSTATPCVNITGRFHVEKLGSQWTYCTPLGNSFFLHGVYVMDYAGDSGYNTKIIAKYGSALNWATANLQRIQNWGFNSPYYHSNSVTSPFATDPSYPLDPNGIHSIPVKMPIIIQVQPALKGMQNAVLTTSAQFPTGQMLPIGSAIKDIAFGWPAVYNSPNGPFGFVPPNGEADYFDPNFSVWLTNYLQTQTPNAHTNPYVDYVMGIVYDDGDELYGWGAGPDFTTQPPGLNNPHLSWLIATMTPVQNVLNLYPTVYTNNTVYTKRAWQTYLQSKYGTIAALNTAWGSTYTSFGSSGTAFTNESVGTGDGVTKIFTHTIAHLIPSPYTLQIFVGGALFGGDLGHANSGVGNMYGVTAAVTPVQTLSGTINYASGLLSLTFVTAPASGAVITVSYTQNGWEEGGTGLMDEDGRASHNAWMSSDPVFLAGVNANTLIDFNTFLVQFTQQYLTVCKAAVQASLPGFLLLGPDSFGSGAIPPRAQVLQGITGNLDVYTGGVGFTNTPDYQAKVDFVFTNRGDGPMMGGSYLTANPDSPYAAFPLANTFPTQLARGQGYATQLALWKGAAFTANGAHPFVGMSPFAFLDIRSQNANFGLVSLLDNAYDGRETVTGTVACSPPIQAFTCGGEAANYGDYIDSVRTANIGTPSAPSTSSPCLKCLVKEEKRNDKDRPIFVFGGGSSDDDTCYSGGVCMGARPINYP